MTQYPLSNSWKSTVWRWPTLTRLMCKSTRFVTGRFSMKCAWTSLQHKRLSGIFCFFGHDYSDLLFVVWGFRRNLSIEKSLQIYLFVRYIAVLLEFIISGFYYSRFGEWWLHTASKYCCLQMLTGEKVTADHAVQLLEKRFSSSGVKRDTTILLVDEVRGHGAGFWSPFPDKHKKVVLMFFGRSVRPCVLHLLLPSQFIILWRI